MASASSRARCGLGCVKPISVASSGRLWLAAEGRRMRARSRVSRISMDGSHRPAAARKSTSSRAPCPTGWRPRRKSASSRRADSALAAPRSSSGLIPVSRRTVSGTARPGSTSRSSVVVTRSGVKATAPTSITLSRAASRPVVSRSRAAYSGTGTGFYVRQRRGNRLRSLSRGRTTAAHRWVA